MEDFHDVLMDIDVTDNVKQNLSGVEVTVDFLIALAWNLSKWAF